jgi:type-F conjugative transfer system mating-pair stabilization protein TraN
MGGGRMFNGGIKQIYMCFPYIIITNNNKIISKYLISTLRCLLFVVLTATNLLILSTVSQAKPTCTKVDYICTKPNETRDIDGLSVTRDCWEYTTVYKCSKESFLDYCTGIDSTIGCEEINSQCLKVNNDIEVDNTNTNTTESNCDEETKTYQCGFLLNKTNYSILLDSEYTILPNSNTSLPKCNSSQQASNCTNIGKLCIEPAEIRTIDGISIYKDCWNYKDQYVCNAGYSYSECEVLQNSSECVLKKQTCLTKDKNNANFCTYNQKEYACNTNEYTTPTMLACDSSIYCIEGDCENPASEEDTDFARAISYLMAAEESGKTMDKNNITIFKGQSHKCDKTILSAKDCCVEEGWAMDYGLAGGCSSEEMALAEKQSERLCHYIGSYCSSEEKLTGTCLVRTKGYCCFDSKLSKIIHEQGRPQLGIGWGSAEAPNCRALTPEELQRIDFSAIDFSELYEDIYKRMTIPNPDELGQAIQQKVQEYYE